MSPTFMPTAASRLLSRRRFLGSAAVAGLALTGCQIGATGSANSDGAAAADRQPDWTDATHGSKADPNYAVVFPTNKVNQLSIVVPEAGWNEMLADMTKLFGARGVQGGNAGGMPGGAPGQGPNPGQGGQGGPRGGGMGGPGGGADMTPNNPMWLAATIEFNGKKWTNVGVRFKGNSSLSSAWRSGSDKIPFKLDFDQFEDQYPEIRNQRFYGFKQLSLGNNFSDASNIRETVASDIFSAAGLVAARTGFYEILLDHGQGRQSLGLYTAVEVIDDTVVPRAFKQKDGNLYEADGAAANLATSTFDKISASFQVESDEKKADWSDIKALVNALNAADRTSNPAAWRKNLESVFNVDVYLRWLGLAAALQHWDTYGGMTHNYYLYNDPATKQLTWISWDHNQILGSGPGGGQQPANGGGAPAGGMPGGQPGGMQGPMGGPGGPGGRGQVTLDRKTTGSEWPLIRYVLDDFTYYGKYISLMRESVKVLDPAALEKKYQAYAAALAPTAEKAGGAPALQAAIAALTQLTKDRYAAVNTFLATA